MFSYHSTISYEYLFNLQQYLHTVSEARHCGFLNHLLNVLNTNNDTVFVLQVGPEEICLIQVEATQTRYNQVRLISNAALTGSFKAFAAAMSSSGPGSIDSPLGQTKELQRSSIDIILPYASFDLKVDFPIVGNKTRYYPLKRAVNDTQYTLGRTFLQEAYLTVDYERSQFYISQCSFNPGVSEHIIAIPSLTSTSASPETKKSLSTEAIAEIAVAGALIGIAAIVFLILFLRRKKKNRTKSEAHGSFPPDQKEDHSLNYGKAELDAKEVPRTEYKIRGEGVEFYKPDKYAPPEPSPPPQPVYEMIGEGINLPELPSPASQVPCSPSQVPSPSSQMPSPSLQAHSPSSQVTSPSSQEGAGHVPSGK